MAQSKHYTERFFRFENDDGAKSIVGNKHYHGVFEVYYLVQGSCHYFIDNRCYDITAGDLVLIPEGVIHHTAYSDGYHSRKLMYFSRSLIPSPVSDRLPSLLYVYRSAALADDIREIFKTLEREHNSPDPYSDSVIASSVNLLFCLMARNENEYPDSSGESEYVTAAVEYIRKSFTERVTLCEAARAVSVSPEHLSRIFKRETGFTFSEYLTLIRLKRAEELLRADRSASVSEIAYACGFNDSNYFSERFKAHYGTPPARYRREHSV